MVRRVSLLICSGIVLLTAGVARAQSPSTCAFEPATALVTVSVDGQNARLRAVGSTGEIWLDGVPCAGATVFNTDTIQVNGTTRDDQVSLSGRFAPGLTPEATGGSEIEIAFALGGFNDMVIVNLSPHRDRLVFTRDGIDIGNDLDQDILTAGTARITVNAQGGDDHIDASSYQGSTHGPGVLLYGGPGRDVLIGAWLETNALYGEEDDDVLHGGHRADVLNGGPGNDRMFGYTRDDSFDQGSAADGADEMYGGDDIDTVRYTGRTNGVTVTIGDTQPDGEPGEGDRVHADVENAEGGHGPDVLVGNSLANNLQGWGGNDELYGGKGDDVLWGMFGDDILVGDGGDDTLRGGGQDDFLDGGLGSDHLLGEEGNDILHGGQAPDVLDGSIGRDEFFGGDGNDDFINDDDQAETVDCGEGPADDPQPSALDTFIACEQI